MDNVGRLVIDNLRATLEGMASLRCCRSLVLDQDSFLLATGTEAASENWAFVPARFPSKTQIRQTLAFFEKLKLPFIWPVLPGADTTYADMLNEAGLEFRGEVSAMFCTILNSGKTQSDLTFEEVSNAEGAALWAETAWRAFDSPPGASASFVDLALGLAKSDGYDLLLTKREGVPVGTAMLSSRGLASGVGIYYFATLPEARRSGVGTATIYEIFRIALQNSCDLVMLQATPVGAPFYASQGFKSLFKIPLHSFAENVF